VRRAAKIDHTQPAIRACFEAHGWLVRSTAALGFGFPDLVVYKNGETWFVECKTGHGRLRAAQEQFIEDGWPVIVLHSVDEALDWLGCARCGENPS